MPRFYMEVRHADGVRPRIERSLYGSLLREATQQFMSDWFPWTKYLSIGKNLKELGKYI